NIGWQLPKIAWAIKSEQERIEQLVSQNNIDTVISDNRFGAHSSRTRNIFLTHQLHLKIPFRPLSRIANWCNHYFIRRFDELWIPDFADVENSLAGSLSHPPLPQITTHYLGALSRFSTSVVQENTASQYDLFVLMSGPEPQRTFLEEQLIEQIRASGLTAIVAQGKTERRESYTLGRRIKVVNYLSAKEISATAAVSKFMVCRSGYSTIMDLYRLQKNAILIPTPGQTEQEYLADVLRREGIFYSMSQRAFDLKTALSNAKNFTGFRRRTDSRRYTRWSELL
ncbi:MAG: glycosyltransferase, partial [Bacteroidota bacterium]